MLWLLLIPAYFVGTFPSAVWIARSKGVDIHTVGSGNPGASNIARTFGTPWGVLVFVLDGLKGAIPAAVGLLVDDRPLAYAMVGAAVLGHMFPITRRFKGGKGVATMGGASFVLQPLISFGMLLLWIVVRKLTKKASLASLAIMIGYPVCVAIVGAPGWEIVAILAINGLVLARHGENIKRLVRGRELSAGKG